LENQFVVSGADESVDAAVVDDHHLALSLEQFARLHDLHLGKFMAQSTCLLARGMRGRRFCRLQLWLTHNILPEMPCIECGDSMEQRSVSLWNPAVWKHCHGDDTTDDRSCDCASSAKDSWMAETACVRGFSEKNLAAALAVERTGNVQMAIILRLCLNINR
jgi:hypothetical protein